MIQTIHTIYNKWSNRFINALCPLEQSRNYCLIEKVSKYALNICSIPLYSLFGALIIPIELGARAWEWLQYVPKGFEAVLEDTQLWEVENIENISHLTGTTFGISTSHYQYGGARIHPDSHWNSPLISQESSAEPPQSLDQLTLGGVDLWEEPQRVVNTLKEMHLTSFRCSIPEALWPDKEGHFNEVALAEFRENLQLLQDNGIQVVLTLHHFSHPKSFEEEGGFFSEGQCKRFHTFADKMFDTFHDLVNEWCTINEPAVYAVSAYMRGVFPPCNQDFTKMARLMVQFIKVHNRIYQSFKAKSRNRRKSVCIGFSHNVINFKSRTRWNPLTRATASWMSYIFSDAYLNFYATGTFSLQIPFLCNMQYTDPNFFDNDGYLDVIQLQYYTRPLIGMVARAPFIDSTAYPHEAMTNMPFREDPAGIYEALMQLHRSITKPVSITEFGCSTHDETQKKRYMERAFYAIARAKEAGVELPRAHAWTLLSDTHREGVYHEWNESPTVQNFGLCHYSKEGAHHILSPAAQTLQRIAMQAALQAAAAKRAYA